ncbi:MAG: arylsulfatase [Candidatus Solibacter usitatus]|nr:arylsulfatase [Candidatus Solibacter usitatus]
MERRDFLRAAAAAPFVRRLEGAARRPNVILVVADDLGYGDLGCYGQKRIQTPHIDRLAGEGMRFTQAYAGSTVCGPSRCALFTGLHSGHGRMRGNRETWLKPEDFTLGQMFKQAGYQTGLFGKWSLGGIGTDGHPNRKGFDEFFGYFSQMQAHLYYPQMLLHNQQEVNLTGNWGTSRKQYAHDVITERALGWLDKVQGPFFTHIAWTIPHANNELGRDTGNGMEAPSDEPYTSQGWPQVEKNFAAMVTRMDRDMGRLMEVLKRRGLDRDTLVLFTSDNGPHNEGGHSSEFFQSGGPLRGTKRDLYDGGIRVPMIARMPGYVPAGQASDFVWAFWDMLPTCAELAGMKAPAGLDGQSVTKALRGEAQKPHDYLYWEFHERGFDQGVRHQDWKAVRKGLKGKLELYDVKSDIGEKNDIAARHPEAVERIERYLAGARSESADYAIKEASR